MTHRHLPRYPARVADEPAGDRRGCRKEDHCHDHGRALSSPMPAPACRRNCRSMAFNSTTSMAANCRRPYRQKFSAWHSRTSSTTVAAPKSRPFGSYTLRLLPCCPEFVRDSLRITSVNSPYHTLRLLHRGAVQSHTSLDLFRVNKVVGFFSARASGRLGLPNLLGI